MAAPVDQTAERILFEVRDHQVCATVDIQYTGNPEAFAWLVPVPGPPAVTDGRAEVLDELSELTPMQWNFPTAANTRCGWWDDSESPGCACPTEEGGALSGSGYPTYAPMPRVDVLDRQSTETYDTVTLDARDANDVVGWLTENAFNVSENMVPILQTYLDEGQVFLAIKLRSPREASQVRPLRFCYAAAAPQIPLRLTAVAAQPRMAIEVFIAAYTLFSPLDAEHGPPDAEALAFDPLGEVSYPAWLAREAGRTGGRFWVLEFAGRTPQLWHLSPATGALCTQQPDACSADTRCEASEDGEARCLRRCEAGCATSEWCFEGLCRRGLVPLDLPPWLTRYRTRMSPEHMDHDPMFVATPELAAFDGNVDLRSRAPLIECGELTPERLPSPCAFIYCGEGARCVADEDRMMGQAGCDCPAGQVASQVELPGGLLMPTCQPRVNPLGVQNNGGDPCAGRQCGRGTCVAVGGFPACDCEEGAVAYATSNGITCAPPARRSEIFEEGATPNTGNRDDALVARQRPAVPILVVGLLALAGLRKRRRGPR